MQYYEWGEYKQSIEYYTKAIESDPKNYSLWLNRGVCWNQLGKFDEALQDYQYARMLKPNYPLIEKNIRITLGNKTKYNEYNLKKIKKEIQNQKNAYENLQRHRLKEKYRDKICTYKCLRCNATTTMKQGVIQYATIIKPRGPCPGNGGAEHFWILVGCY